jgi:hypothetical protein
MVPPSRPSLWSFFTAHPPLSRNSIGEWRSLIAMRRERVNLFVGNQFLNRKLYDLQCASDSPYLTERPV